MLRKEAVVQEIIDTVKELQQNSMLNNFYLAGGTALALQIGHRTSTDIDLFCYDKDKFLLLNEHLEKNANIYNVDTNVENFIRIFKNGIKVELVNDFNGKLIIPPLIDEGILMLDKQEIAPMKLFANLGRKRYRDVIDIAFLLQEIPVIKMFDLYKEKYGPFNINVIKRELLNRSENIHEGIDLEGIKMIRNDIQLNDIPSIIKNAIEEFNSQYNIGFIEKKYGNLEAMACYRHETPKMEKSGVFSDIKDKEILSVDGIYTILKYKKDDDFILSRTSLASKDGERHLDEWYFKNDFHKESALEFIKQWDEHTNNIEL